MRRNLATVLTTRGAVPRAVRTAVAVCAVLVMSVVAFEGVVRAQTKGPLAPLDFLVGRWDALPDATGALGWCSFSLGVQDHVLVRTNHSDSPASARGPAAAHDDLMTIYADGAVLKADYLDSEGHVIRYVVQSPSANDAVFQADPTASAPGYRLSYALQADGTVKGIFEIAPPGKPGAWSPYLSWSMRKVRTIK